jgi:hypothetical protein
MIPVGDRAQRMRNVLDPNDGVIGLERRDQVDQSGDLMLGQSAGDLIEQQKLGARGDRFGELQTFAVEQTEVTGRLVGVRQQPGFVQHVDRKLLRIRAGQAGAVERGSQDVLIHAQLREWPRNLKCAHNAEPRAPVRGDAADIAPLEPDDTAIGRDDAGEHVEQRTFAGAVWSDQSDAGGAIDRAADVVGHDDGAIPLVQMIDFEQCGHRSSRPAHRFKWKGAFRPRLGGSLAGTL